VSARSAASGLGADEVLDAVLALARGLHLELPEDELARRCLDTLAALLPGRHVVVRLDADGGRLVEHTAGARLVPEALRGPIALKASSLAKTRVAPEVAASGRVRVVDAPPPVVAGAPAGFSIPLVAGGELYGALDVAYPGAGDAEADERSLIPVANQLAVAVRNGRLHQETSLLRDYLGKIIDHAGALLIGVDPEWRVTVYNRALESLTGYGRRHVVGSDVRRWLPKGERARLVRAVLEARAGRPVAPLDLEHRSSDGRTLRTVWQVTTVGTGGRVEAVVAVGQDVTQIRSLEKQVLQAEKLATLGQLAAGVVHELNNPLTQVMVYAEFLLKKLERAGEAAGPFGPPDAEKLRRILDGAERILKLSRELVQYAKPSGTELDVLSLNDVVQEALSFCEHLVRRAGVSLFARFEDGLPPLYAVRHQLQQVVINLVTNAVQALPAGGGQVRVTTFRPPQATGDAPLVGFTVADDGAGIAPEHLPHIFEPFFTTKTEGRGTGLGLSIVQGIVDRHQGRIAVESRQQERQGTRFTVVLPTGHAVDDAH
jgi:PAS domain S-box-containing protein